MDKLGRGRLLKRLLVGGAMAVTVAGSLLYQRREGEMERLFAEAGGTPPFFHGTDAANAAVEKLATYGGSHSTALLWRIARGETPFPWPDTEAKAVEALGARHDPDIPVALARLLQPHEYPAVRAAVARTLRNLPCTGECIDSVMHYLERIWHGASNYEDPDKPIPPQYEAEVRGLMRRDQQKIYDALYVVLERQDSETLAKLQRVYGVGSSVPSRFALNLLTHVRLPQACPALLASQQALAESSAKPFDEIRQDLDQALAVLNCRAK